MQPSHIVTVRGMMLRFTAFALITVFTFALWGCGNNNNNENEQNQPSIPTLYDQLGGQDGIQQISETFLGNVAADDRINNFIAKADKTKLTSDLTDFLCEQTDGPQVYTGPDPEAASQGLGITDANWDAAVEDLKAALATLKVPASSQEELLDVIEPIKTDVVGH